VTALMFGLFGIGIINNLIFGIKFDEALAIWPPSSISKPCSRFPISAFQHVSH
jgi:hypothetical protein